MGIEYLAIFALLGGVALFLTGLEILTQGLRQSAGPLMRRILRQITSNPMRGAASGIGISTLIHNGPTTVVVFGYVTAGLLSLSQAIPVIFGANIGTTLSMQVVSFDLGKYSFLLLAVGVILRRFLSEENTLRKVALILVGFGMMFVGLETTKTAFEPLRDSSPIQFLMVMFETHTIFTYLSLLVISAIITALFQSSGIVISLLFSMAALGIMSDFSSAIPFLLGAHIGSTMTAVLAAWQNKGCSATWRLAICQILFNVFGAIIATLMFGIYTWIIPLTSDDTVRQIANFNTLKQVVSLLLFLPFAGLFEKFAVAVTQHWGMEDQETSHLDPVLLERPERAILAVLHELKRKASITRNMLSLSFEGMLKRNPRVFKTVSVQAESVNTIQRETQNYISSIADRKLEPRQVLLIQKLAVASESIEGVNGYVQGLAELLREKIERRVWFPDNLVRSFMDLNRQVTEMMEITINGIDPTGSVSSECASRAIALAEHIHITVADLKECVKVDVKENSADGTTTVFFLRYIYFLERIVSYLESLATQEQDEVWDVRESRLLDVSALRSRAVKRISGKDIQRESYESIAEDRDF